MLWMYATFTVAIWYDPCLVSLRVLAANVCRLLIDTYAFETFKQPWQRFSHFTASVSRRTLLSNARVDVGLIIEILYSSETTATYK